MSTDHTFGAIFDGGVSEFIFEKSVKNVKRLYIHGCLLTAGTFFFLGEVKWGNTFRTDTPLFKSPTTFQKCPHLQALCHNIIPVLVKNSLLAPRGELYQAGGVWRKVLLDLARSTFSG